MSRRIDLLPAEYRAARRERHVLQRVALVCGALVVAVVGLGVLQANEVGEAKRERDRAQAQVATLETRRSELEEYRGLDARAKRGDALLAVAMAPEISWAQVLNDLSLAFPATSSLTELTGAIEPTEAAVADVDGEVGDLAVGGYSIEQLAPGVQQVLTDLSATSGFDAPYLSEARSEDVNGQRITNFAGSLVLDGELRTGRSDDGLPPAALR